MNPGRWIAVIFGAILIFGGFFIPLDSATRIVALFAGTGSILVGAFDPDNLMNVKFGKKGVELTRYQPTVQEREIALKLAQDKTSPEIEKEGEKFIEKAGERTPEQRSPEDYLALATEKWRAKDYDVALADVFAGLALNPEDVRIKSTLIYRKGTIFADLGLLDEAIKHYNEAMKLDSEFSWPHTGLAVLYFDQGKLAEAEEENKKAISLDPNDAFAHQNLGIVYDGQGKQREAETEYKKGIALNPKDAQCHYNLGVLYRQQGKQEEAEAKYKKAIELDPRYAKPHLNLGVLYKQQGKLKEAKREYEEALQIEPDYTLAKNNLKNLKRIMKEDK